MIRPANPADTPTLLEMTAATGFFKPHEVETLQLVLDDYTRKIDTNRPVHLQSAEAAKGQLTLLIAKLNEVSREMAQGVDWAKSLERIINIERVHREQLEMLQTIQRNILGDIFNKN